MINFNAWTPKFRVMLRDREANVFILFEAAIGSVKSDRWWFKRIISVNCHRAEINSIFVTMNIKSVNDKETFVRVLIFVSKEYVWA